MADSPSRYEILVDIKARLDEITKANAEFRKTRDEARAATTGVGNFFAQFRQGLGIGAGMFTVANAVAMVKNVVVSTTREALAMAGAIKDGAEALSMSRRGYQVYGEVMREAGGAQERMTMAIAETNRKLVEARALGGSAAGAFRFFGLDPAQLEGMTVERRMEAIGRAIAGATDKQEAFRQAGILLGSRNLPTLLNALKQLGLEGYDTLAAKVEKAGRVMSDDTIARLDKAEKAIANFKRAATISVGEGLSGLAALKQSASSNFWGTAAGILRAGILGDYGALSSTVAANVPLEREPDKSDPAAAERAAAEQRLRLQLRETNLELLKRELAFEQSQASISLTDQERRDAEIEYLDAKAKLLSRIADLTEQLPVENGDEGARTEELMKLRGAALGATIQSGGLSLPISDAALINRQYADFSAGRNADGGARLSAGDGLMAGYKNWAMSLGTVGEQAAGALQSTLGTTVDGISQSILGWATGMGNFSDVARSTGLTILQTMLQTLVQMGVQQLLNGTIFKTTMLGIETLMDTLRGARVAKDNAAEMATLPAKTAGAAASGISSFGSALVFGAAAIALVMAAMSAFADGGAVRGPGGPRDDKIFARLSNGEYVVPAHIAQNPSNAGLMATLEGQRTGSLPGYSLGGFVRDLVVYGGIPKFMLPKAARNFLEGYNWIDGTRIHGGPQGNGYEYVDGQWRPIGSSLDRYRVATGSDGSGPVYSSGARGASIAPVSGRSTRYLVFTDDRNVLANLQRDPQFENVVVDIGVRNRGVILEGGA